MSMDNLRKQINSLAKAIENSEKVALPIFAIKLAKASESYPEDTTIGMMHEVVARMAGTNKIFITKKCGGIYFNMNLQNH